MDGGSRLSMIVRGVVGSQEDVLGADPGQGPGGLRGQGLDLGAREAGPGLEVERKADQEANLVLSLAARIVLNLGVSLTPSLEASLAPNQSARQSLAPNQEASLDHDLHPRRNLARGQDPAR